MIFIHYDPKRFPATIDETLCCSCIAFGLGSVGVHLRTCLFVDSVTENGTIDFQDFNVALAMGTCDEERHTTLYSFDIIFNCSYFYSYSSALACTMISW
jgi:hypothetical protein